ncbi:MAG: NIPSNAP family protein [Caulobacteraceae bacterium]
MITLYIRYTLDMYKISEFETYLKALVAPVSRCGGVPAGYYLPTNFAGPMNAAIGLTDFPDWAAYGAFREKMAVDPEGIEIRRRVEASGAILSEDRSFLSVVPETRP